VPPSPEAQGKRQTEGEAEPLPGTRRKRPNNARERAAEATQLSNEGHLVNPLGRTDARGRTLRPERAKPIGESGAITISQLWGAYVAIFEDSFGIKDFLPQIMAPTRENVSRFFDDLRQKFLERTGYLPDNRDLHEYLRWFHQPERLKGLLAVGKRSGDRGYVTPYMLSGLVYIRSFYDQRLRHKAGKDDDLVSEGAARRRVLSKFLQEAYDEIREAHAQENEATLARLVVRYGYVIFAEWLYDYKGMDGSACKSRIIDLMAAYIKGCQNRDKAAEFLSSARESTEANVKVLDSSVWADWRETCRDLVSVAKDKVF
jgi:hypothetical protein